MMIPGWKSLFVLSGTPESISKAILTFQELLKVSRRPFLLFQEPLKAFRKPFLPFQELPTEKMQELSRLFPPDSDIYMLFQEQIQACGQYTSDDGAGYGNP